MKRVVCYSGGHSSGLVAIEVACRYPDDEIVLLNHDLPFWTKDADIKRFKRAVAEYLGCPVTYASHANAQLDQFGVTVAKKAFKVDGGQEFCTSVLKTEPFMKWLAANADTVCYYGFDANETGRLQRRSSIMAALGWKTDYPLALWTDRTIVSTLEIGIRECRDDIASKHVIHYGHTQGRMKAGRSPSARNIAHMFATCRDDAKISIDEGKTPPSFHEIRSLAARLYGDQYGAAFAQAMLGHRSAQMTALYRDSRGREWTEVHVEAI